MSSTGGPAFPTHHNVGPHAHWGGMNLRDYCAIHSTQPGVDEICKVAGVLRVSHSLIVVDGHQTTFDEWWRSLSLETICELSAKVRYAQADAMIKVRHAND